MMNEKELKKLKRQDLLQLLLLQGRENAKLQNELKAAERVHDETREERAKLAAQLEQKEAQIAQLMQTLSERDKQLAHLLRQLNGSAPPMGEPPRPPGNSPPASKPPPDEAAQGPPLSVAAKRSPAQISAAAEVDRIISSLLQSGNLKDPRL